MPGQGRAWKQPIFSERGESIKTMNTANESIGEMILDYDSLGTMEGVMKEGTPVLSVVMILGAAICGALGSYLYKTGAQASGETLGSLVTQPRIAGGVFCYLLVPVLLGPAAFHLLLFIERLAVSPAAGLVSVSNSSLP